MPLYDKVEMSEQAQRYGFLRDTFEKVYRLIKILSYFQNNDLTQRHLVLKGGRFSHSLDAKRKWQSCISNI
jgi:hypothetical protein